MIMQPTLQRTGNGMTSIVQSPFLFISFYQFSVYTQDATYLWQQAANAPKRREAAETSYLPHCIVALPVYTTNQRLFQ